MAFTLLNPLLSLPPLIGLLIISFLVSLIATVVYKYTTDQIVMKSLRDEIKGHQQKMKEQRSDPKKMMESQKKAMEANMQYMMKSLKPTLFTLIPLLLVFTWLGSHYAYEPLRPGIDFNITVVFKEQPAGVVALEAPKTFTVKGEKVQQAKAHNTWVLTPKQEGSFILEFTHDDKTYQKEVLITNFQEYEAVEKDIQKDNVEKIQVGHNKVRPLGDVSIFSWHPGWLAIYIISSILFSLGLKRLLKLH